MDKYDDHGHHPTTEQNNADTDATVPGILDYNITGIGSYVTGLVKIGADHCILRYQWCLPYWTVGRCTGIVPNQTIVVDCHPIDDKRFPEYSFQSIPPGISDGRFVNVPGSTY